MADEKSMPNMAPRAKYSVTYDGLLPDYLYPETSGRSQQTKITESDIRSYAHLVFPFCASLLRNEIEPVDCIEGISIFQEGSGKWLPGNWGGYVPITSQPTPLVEDQPGTLSSRYLVAKSELDVLPDEQNGLIAGARSALWDFSGIEHSAGKHFLVTFSVGVPIYNGKADVTDMVATFKVSPVRVTGSIAPELGGTSLVGAIKRGDGEFCAVVKVNYCLTVLPFESIQRFKLDLIMKQTAPMINSTSWLMGQSRDPLVTQKVDSVDRTIKHFSIIASSSEIQVPDILIKSDDEVRRYFNAVMPDPPDSLAEDRRKRWIAQRDLKLIRLSTDPQ
jgi:hypothetical protein